MIVDNSSVMHSVYFLHHECKIKNFIHNMYCIKTLKNANDTKNKDFVTPNNIYFIKKHYFCI